MEMKSMLYQIEKRIQQIARRVGRGSPHPQIIFMCRKHLLI
jgi:hypothetical protein